MTNVILVFFGGGLGAAARYLLQGVFYRVAGTDVPYGTVLVNVVGCFLIGLIMAGSGSRFLLSPSLRIFLTIGILGGFTTFSSFSYETIALLRDDEIFLASLNVVVSIVSCLGATFLGTIIGKMV